MEVGWGCKRVKQSYIIIITHYIPFAIDKLKENIDHRNMEVVSRRAKRIESDYYWN